MATASVECNKVLDAKDNENNLLAFPSLVSDYNDPNAEDCLYFAPYGQTTAVNVLENFLGTPDTVTKVLFLKSGDMRNALCTAAQITEAYQELSVHLTDPNDLVVARNILLAHIMLSDDFDASNPVDIQYLWDIWYSLRWTEVTRSRFLKDVEHLLTFQWSTAAHIVIEAGVSVKLLERILKAWLETATKMSSQSVVNISKHRVKTIIQDESFEMAMQRVENIDSYLSQNLTTEQRMNKLANTIYSKKRINLKLEEESIKKEIECFLRTGNFEPVDLVVCLNPTLLSEGVDNEKLCWEVAYHTCPFDAYFPVPLKDKLANLEKNFTSAYDYCKSKLQSLVSELQSRKRRVSFHFYFCDWVELCLFDKDQKLKNKFHVAHCSELADTVGLANVLVAVTGCLIQDYPEALLLTETTDWTKHHLLEEEIPSISEYVEMALCCPLSMVPTFYGLKLVNHTKLGSAVCIQMHDSSSTSSIMLSWVIAPTYSSNVSLDISPALKNALAPLAECCYIVSEEWNCQPFPTQAPNSLGLRRTNDVHYLLPYTPLTYHLVLQSVEKRFVWLPGAAKSLFLDAVPAPHQLACKTQQSWLNGEPVLLFTIKASSFQRLQESLDEMDAQLLLMTDEELALRENYPEDHLKGHCIDFVCWSDCMVGNMDHVNGIIVSDDDEEEEGDQERAEKSFSFFLASDHGLPLNTRFCIHNGEESTITTFGLFTDFTNQVVTNECPLLGEKRLPLESDSEASGLHIVKCLESKDRYDLDICVKGFPTTSTKDFRITTNKQHPSLSAHQITLALAGVAPVVMQVPWPILAADVKISIPKKLKDKLLFNLKLTKSLNDPWPAEFIGSSKWDADQLVQWKELVSNGDFKKHIEAQFPCDHLHTEKYTPEDKPESSSLAKVGEAVRAIFYGYCDDSFQLFAICDPLTQEPIFHLRVHPPMRFSPQGAPLLLMSLLDHQLVHGLVTEGKLDAEQSQADFHRIITEGVSRNVCKVQLSSPEEVRLLRYSLRLNSTKILRNAWQSKNFPKGEDSPWMASFVSPLYAEEPLDMCALLEMKHNRDPSYLLSLALAEGFSRIILGGQDDNDGDDSYTDSEYDSN